MMNDFSSAYKDKVRTLCTVARDRALGSVRWSRSVDLPPTLPPETARPTCQSLCLSPVTQNSLSEAITEINAPERDLLNLFKKIYISEVKSIWSAESGFGSACVVVVSDFTASSQQGAVKMSVHCKGPTCTVKGDLLARNEI